MPWEHCGEPILDTEACPACQITKDEWTVQFDVTRTFQVSRRALLRLELLNPVGGPVAGESVQVTPPGEGASSQAIALNEYGFGKLALEEPGACRVVFTERGPESVRRLPDEDAEDEEEESEDDGDPDTGEPDVEHPTFQCELQTRKHRFGLCAELVLELHDAWLPDDAVLRIEGLADPLELRAGDCHDPDRWLHGFPVYGTVADTDNRGVLVIDGEEHVLFEEVDLHAQAQALRDSGDEQPEPFHLTWPDRLFDPAHAPPAEEADTGDEPEEEADASIEPGEVDFEEGLGDDDEPPPAREPARVEELERPAYAWGDG